MKICFTRSKYRHLKVNIRWEQKNKPADARIVHQEICFINGKTVFQSTVETSQHNNIMGITKRRILTANCRRLGLFFIFLFGMSKA